MTDRFPEVPGQLTVFDLVRAAKHRDQAIDEVETHADEEWVDCALTAVRATAETLEEFTTDDCAHYLARVFPEVWTHETRAWGAVIRKAVKEGWIVNSGRMRKSTMVSNHRRPKTVWRSLI